MIKKIVTSSRTMGFFIVAFSAALIIGISAFHATVRANDLPIVHVGGTLSSDQTWSGGLVYLVDDTVTVPNGVTLTIDAGAIIKGAYTKDSIKIQTGGALQANGTASEPVIFTSHRDDSAGGDSEGDGPTVGLRGDYQSAIQIAGGTSNVTHAVFRDSWTSFSTAAPCSGTLGPNTVTDSLFNATFYLPYSCAGTLALERNDFAMDSMADEAIMVGAGVDVTGISLSGVNTNVVSGSSKQQHKVEVYGRIPTGKTWSINNASGAVLNANGLQVAGTLDLGEGVVAQLSNDAPSITVTGTANLAAGSILKTVNAGYGFAVSNGGIINANGTAEAPVIFTSYKDDSAGGDTNADGPSAGSSRDYMGAIQLKGGSVNASHVSFLYSGAALLTPSSCSGSLGTVSIIDSSLEAPISIFRCIHDISLERNQFNVPTAVGLPIQIGDNIDISGIALSGVDKNIFSGNSLQRIIEVNGSIPLGKVWSIASDSGAIVKVGALTVNGSMNIGANVQMIANGNWDAVQVNGTVSIADGATIKINGYHYSGNGFTINSGGTLNVTGVSSSPVTFTSLKDDIGGDLAGDGATTGARADYGSAVIVNSGGAATFQHANFAYGGLTINQQGGQLTLNSGIIENTDTALYAAGGQANLNDITVNNIINGLYVFGQAQVTFRGSIENANSKAVQACNWHQDCTVDAAYTDWGSAGPFPVSGNMACGQVTVSPWRIGASTASASIFAIHNCDGSTPTPDQQLSSSISAFQDRVNSHQVDCSNGFQDACNAMSQAYACLSGAVNVAGSTSPFPLPDAGTAGAVETFGSDLLEGASVYVNAQELESVTGQGLGFASGLHSVIGLFFNLKDAYDHCG